VYNLYYFIIDVGKLQWIPCRDTTGTVDIDQHGHIFGACLKLHEDKLACNDVIQANAIGTRAASRGKYSFQPCHAMFDHA
jgi:hypothetical protein